MRIITANPGAAFELHRHEINAAIKRVLQSGWYILGEEVQQFEADFSQWHHFKEVIGVASGTDALELAFRTLAIGAGDEVITTTHTASATVSAIELVGATPVFSDIDPLTYNIDANHVEKLITPRTKAVVAVHLYGLPADLTRLKAITDQHNLYLIEDAAQAHGARYHGKYVGQHGIFTTFSFYPTKNLGAPGDGGALATQSDELAKRARVIAQYGWEERYIASYPGMNTRLDELHAAVLRVRLRYLAADNTRRREIAARYHTELKDLVITPIIPNDVESVYHLYVIRHPERDRLREFLQKHDIHTSIQYPQPIHLQPAYIGRLAQYGDCPHAEALANEILSLPMYPELSDAEVDRVIQCVQEFFA